MQKPVFRRRGLGKRSMESAARPRKERRPPSRSRLVPDARSSRLPLELVNKILLTLADVKMSCRRVFHLTFARRDRGLP